MSLYDNRSYYFNKLFLSIIGLWPYQTRLEGNMTFVVAFVFLCSLTIFELWGLISGITDTYIVMENMSLLLVNTICFIKLINYLYNKNKVKELLDYIEEIWKAMEAGPQNNILINYAEQNRSLTIKYAFTFYLIWFLFAVLPHAVSGIYLIFPMNETYTAKFLYRFEHVVDMDKYFGILSLHAIISAFYIVSVPIAVDCLFVACIQHVCALFEIVRYDMNRIRSLDTAMSHFNVMGDEAYHVIINCIKVHKHALKFSERLSSAYAMSYLFLLGNIVVCLSFSAAELIMLENKLDEVVRIVSAIVAQLLHVYYLSLTSQQLIDYSSGLHEVIYSCNWFTISPRSKQLLKFMLLRTTKPCQIKAGKLYVMSMENFSSILRVSMSYFTMLTSLQ